MKKLLSIFLAALMVAMCAFPAFATDEDVTAVNETEGENQEGAEESTTKHSVSFTPPSAEFAGGYLFAKTIDGEVQYKPDENGEYVFFDNRYMLPSNIVHEEDIPDERFSPVEWDVYNEVAEGETVAFKIVTSEKYNVLTAAVFINGKPANLNAQDEYTVYVDRDLVISVQEYDENGQVALLRNHFNVKLTSGEGYKVRTLKGENYEVTYYGDSFEFRVHVSSGYSASGIKVSVQRGQNALGGFLDEEDGDMLAGIIGGTEALTSYGVDEDGCRLYRIDNITTDCKVIVSGVEEESSAGIMSFLKRILRLILNFLGIKLDILDSFTAYYNISIDASQVDGVTYQVIRSSEEELSPADFTVTGGEGITIIVTKKDPMQNVNVMWTPGNETGSYQTDWKIDYNTMTGEVSYFAIYNIDNIAADTQIIIS